MGLIEFMRDAGAKIFGADAAAAAPDDPAVQSKRATAKIFAPASRMNSMSPIVVLLTE